MMTIEQFREALKQKYTSLGGYPTYFFMKDSEALCHDCAKENQAQIESAITDGYDKWWIPVSQEVNWESDDLYCDHCHKDIESAYGGDK